MEVQENPPLPAEEVEWNREESTNEETPQQFVVNGTNTKHLLRPKGTPEDRSSEEDVGTRTSKVVLLVWCAKVGDCCYYTVEGNCAGESGNKGSKYLAVEGDPRWNMGVMSKFEILGKVEGTGGSGGPIALEIEHCSGISWKPEATKQLRDDVEGNLYIGGSHYYTTGYAESCGK